MTYRPRNRSIIPKNSPTATTAVTAAMSGGSTEGKAIESPTGMHATHSAHAAPIMVSRLIPGILLGEDARW